MRRLIPDVLTAAQCASLAATTGYLAWQDDRLLPVLAHLSSCLPKAGYDPPSYVRVEQRSEGHGWHCDKGNNGHMDWCAYTASVLLSPPEDYSGGTFKFEDGQEHHHYRDLLYYSSDERHMVERHRGNRMVLLMFMNEADKPT